MSHPGDGDNKVDAPAQVTSQWLIKQLKGPTISSFEYDRVGTGQMSECYRFKLSYADKTAADAPQSVILKVAAQDETSRRTGASYGLYQREVLFYQQVAEKLYHLKSIPRCYHSMFYEETDSFCLLLEDAVAFESGNDIKGATVPQAKTCLAALGRVHGQLIFKGVDQYGWLKQSKPLTQATLSMLFQEFMKRYRGQVSTEHIELCSQLVNCFDSYTELQRQDRVQGLIHGDFRLDNILLGKEENNLNIVDWQTVTWGPLLGDVAYFIGCALETETRRTHFNGLMNAYFDALGDSAPFSREGCLEELRASSFFGIVMGVASSILVQQTERGDEMFMTMLRRHCELVIDLKGVELLPAPSKMEILQPLPEDEHLHPQESDKLFNESYYFDFVDPEQGIAAYIRLGITPNVQKGGWYLAVVCRRGKPMVAIMDYASPIVGSTLQLKTPDYEASHTAVDPLKTFDITLDGKGVVHHSEADVLAGKPAQGEEKLSLDLTFRTNGIPYHYRITTRYEIPCLVDGRVSIGGQEIVIQNQVGQRDHSWGVRNWWSMDWLWSSIHLEDGSHIHIVDLYVKDHGQLGVGYYQNNEIGVLECSGIDSKWHFDATTNLASGTSIQFTPQDGPQYEITAEPQGHGPLRLVSEDGSVSFFDRAWCKCTLNDGRCGYGWLEWNRVQ